MSSPLRLGIAGLGTVGVGLVRIIQRNADLLALRAGRPIEITAVCARSRTRNRGVDISGYAWEDDPVTLVRRDDVDLVVELMGGENGPAKALTEAAIAAGKDVVTANKALLAMHGLDLARAAEEAGVALRFEAAVAGGIPVIKALSEGLAGNRISCVKGVMNGTCNYILTRMEDAGLPYETVFEEANQLGYLEADPTLDVGGIDAAHKLTLLSAIAFGVQPDFDAITTTGIERISIEDIRAAADLRLRIKLLGVARLSGRGLEQSMSPCLVPADSPLGQLKGGTNMVVIEGDAIEQVILRGPGAGEGPTASAVIGDIIDIARGLRLPVFGQPVATLQPAVSARATAAKPWYLRMTLLDKPGALAKVAEALGNAGVSINRMRQYGHEDTRAPVVIITHKTTRDAIDHAASLALATGVLVGEPVAMAIEAD
ncbi:MAG: homoserine dehydrogenase [Rhodobacteraceae bacterium]|nr:homoserine dehydrogenase [Paracoccaceae bacterium]